MALVTCGLTAKDHWDQLRKTMLVSSMGLPYLTSPYLCNTDILYLLQTDANILEN